MIDHFVFGTPFPHHNFAAGSRWAKKKMLARSLRFFFSLPSENGKV